MSRWSRCQLPGLYGLESAQPEHFLGHLFPSRWSWGLPGTGAAIPWAYLPVLMWGSNRRAEGGRGSEMSLQTPSQKAWSSGARCQPGQAARQVESNLIQPTQIQLCPVNSERVSRWCPGVGSGDRCCAARLPGPSADSAACCVTWGNHVTSTGPRSHLYRSGQSQDLPPRAHSMCTPLP